VPPGLDKYNAVFAFDGTHYTFPSELMPSRISFWFKFNQLLPTVIFSRSKDTQNIRPGGAPNTVRGAYPLYVSYSSTGVIVGSSGLDRIFKNFGPNQWIHVRIDLDWVTLNVTPWVSGIGSDGLETTPVSGTPFGPGAIDAPFKRIDLYGTEWPTIAGEIELDEIELLP